MSAMATRTLGFIAAKGGSTRFPKKNIALLGGKPLLAWTIESARQSGVIDCIAVSSESAEVLACARSSGADLVLERPAALARDPAGIVDVALHHLEELAGGGRTFDEIAILAPTCPLRSAGDVASAVALFRRVAPSFVMSVSEFTHTPFAALVMQEDGALAPAFPEYFGLKSQEMPKAYRPNGAIHVLGVDRFRTTRSYLSPPLIPYVMPRERSIDIDFPADLLEAELLLSQLKKPAGS
jgi:CMP-N-acetylneuraminic acid synthetase